MLSDLPLQKLLSKLVGSGSGSGMAVMFLAVGVLSLLLSLRSMTYNELDQQGSA